MSLLTFLDLLYNRINITPVNNLKIKSLPQYQIFIVQGLLGSFLLTYNTVLKLKYALEQNHINKICFFKTTFELNLYRLNFFYSKILILKGIGFRIELKKTKTNQYLKIKLGYSLPIIIKIPNLILIKIPKNTRLILKSNNLLLLNKFFRFIKRLRLPDRYKGKGLFFRREKFIKKPVIKQTTK